MVFVWDMTENAWDLREQYEDYIGCCRVGNICFDVLTRSDEGNAWVSYDCYIGGVDDGYGYGKDGYPYTYGDGGDWNSLLTGVDLESFKTIAEHEFRKFITSNSLQAKANETLHIW